MGYEAMIVSGVDPIQKQELTKKKELQFVWAPYFDYLGRKQEIFTHVIRKIYPKNLKAFKAHSNSLLGFDTT